MNLNLKSRKPLRIRLSVKSLTKSLMLSIIILTGLFTSVNAQIYKYEKPSWLFGIAGGANFNFHRGSTQQLTADFTPPVAFHDGKGTGLFLAPTIEYNNAATGWGFMLHAGIDNRNSKFDQVISDCDCPADLSVNLNYITVEPSLRFAPGGSNFYLYAGPRFAFNTDKSFTYTLGRNPAFPNQELVPPVKGDISNVRENLISAQIGAGLDIPMNSRDNQIQTILSPFVSFQPYFGQSPRNVETWNITTVRVGAGLKFGRGKEIPVANASMSMDDIYFTVKSPKNIASQRIVSETFPLRNYVFFDLGSTEIPERYVLLNKDQVKDFKEDQAGIFEPDNTSDRSEKVMLVYYNLLNVIGDRLIRNPSTSITLVGSSEKGADDGKKMAESVQKYLTGTFGIAANRIAVQGSTKPKLPSEQPGGTLELDLLREGDRRVSIESNSPELLMEYGNVNAKSLKPVQIKATQFAPLDSYVSFNVEDKNNNLSFWSMDVTDPKGNIKNYGPFTGKNVFLSGKSILGDQTKGDYKFVMKGTKKDGSTFVRNSTSEINLWTPMKDHEGMRYSVLYEFNDSKAIDLYEKYLNEVITPAIPQGSRVYIHGYTDTIGDELNNYNLSLARAHDVHKILEKSLAKAGRKDVTFEVYGFGEDSSLSPFKNTLPEERFYNRTVIIDIIPQH
ncbi:MAG: outer membrane beta-barrel protein [Saprospiraceae bacterium]|nr:outer membrane beta-barrel protein [Saprospiraceae bacterium]